MQTYDPSFFVEKQCFLDELREQAIGQSQEYQDLVFEMTEAYTDVLDLFRQYMDAYDNASQREAWKQFCAGCGRLSYMIDSSYALLRQEDSDETQNRYLDS